VALERFMRCTPKRLAPNGMRAAVLGAAQRADWPKAQQLSADKPSALADGLTRLLALRHLGREGAIAAAGDAASRSLRAHVQKAYPLAVIATVAPIVGLLGTVVGMIDAFHVIAFAGMGDPTLLAGGISKALVNTAAGLCVALPALVLHHFFKQRIAAVGLTIEAELHQVADAMFAPGEQRAH
jgi:biopolymer transport protein ExbB